MRVHRRFMADERGAALTELLIALPVLLFLIVASFNLGYYVMYYHSVEKAVRSGTRYLARLPEAAITGGAWGEVRAKNLMLYGIANSTVPAGTPPLLVDWTNASTIDVETDDTPTVTVPEGEDGSRLIVRVTATVPVNVPILRAFGFEDAFTVEATHEERHVGE